MSTVLNITDLPTGVELVRFTHAKNAAIHGSTKVDDDIRYLSLHDNKYLRYFKGHNRKVSWTMRVTTILCSNDELFLQVVNLEMSPSNDTFLSSSLDNTVRLWDLKSPSCTGVMNVQGKPVCAFDPEGLIFSVGIDSEIVKLYDLRSLDKGPFTTFNLPKETQCEWTSLK